MKTEQLKWIYDFNDIEFVHLSAIKTLVTRKFFNYEVYNYLMIFYKKNNFKNDLIPLVTFEKLIRKYPKKKSCWCLSGLNFIDCHFYRETKKPANLIHQKVKKILNTKECLHKNISTCSPLVIKAHSISNKGSLSFLSQKNHVYGMKLDYKKFKFTKLGINNASTFYGFCKTHDDLLFSSFEKNNFDKTNKQLFDLCYRALCQEHYTMLRTRDLVQEVKKYSDNGSSLIKQIEFQAQINSQIHFYDLGLKYSNYYKLKLEAQYINYEYENIFNHYIFELDDGYPKFQSSSCFNLEFDFLGKRLQNLDNAYIQSKNLFVNCVSFKSKGYFILSWFKENDSFGKQIIDSLISIKELINDKLFTFVFLYIHNTFVSPEWYESLTQPQKR